MMGYNDHSFSFTEKIVSKISNSVFESSAFVASSKINIGASK